MATAVTSVRPAPAQAAEADARPVWRRMPTTRQLVAAVHVLVVLCCCAFVWSKLQPRWILTDTTPAGGDMGAHVWGPAWLRDHLLPKGRLSGWSPDWYSGMPVLHFYFPLPSTVIALLSHVLPYNIAFKLVTVSGLVSLPASAAAFGAWSGMRRPYAACLAVATVPFLFDQGFTIYGGNVASTLAGEFSFSISLSFALLFLGLLARAQDTGKGRGWAAVAFACCVLSHILPGMFAIAGAVLLTLVKPGVKRFWASATVGLAGACITAFWLLPFAFRLPYTNDMGWEKVTRYLLPLIGSSSEVPPERLTEIGQSYLDVQVLRWVFYAALAGACLSLLLQRRLGTVLTGTALVAALAFRFMPGPTAEDPFGHGKLWNARMLPFWYLSLYLLAACLVAELALGAIALWRRIDRTIDPEHLAAADERVRSLRALAAVAAAAGFPSAPGLAAGADRLQWEADDLRDRAASRRAVPQILVPVVAAFVVLGLVAVPFQQSWLPVKTDKSTIVDDWARWNYVGYEGEGEGPSRLGAKSRRDEMFDLIGTLTQVGAERGCGRALWEYESELDGMGTPLALMLLPYWTKSCIGSSEGLYFESSPTTAHHFMTAGSVTKSPSNPERGLPYTGLDLANVGIPRMQLLGMRYYLAISPEAKEQADADPRLVKVAESPPHQVAYGGQYETRTWNVYELQGGDLVQPLDNLPVVVRGVPNSEPAWKALTAKGWFKDPARYSTLLAADGPPSWPRVGIPPEPDPAVADDGTGVLPGTAEDDNEPYRRLGAEAELPVRPVTTRPVVTDVLEGDDTLSFRVDQVGVPMLVKVSYFPAWKVEGADGPYRVSPNFMVVIPTSNEVRLEYGRTALDWAGIVLTLAGLVAAVVLNRRRLVAAPALAARLGSRRSARRPAPVAPAEEAAAPVVDEPRGGGDVLAEPAVGDGRVPPEREPEPGEALEGAGYPAGDRGPGGP